MATTMDEAFGEYANHRNTCNTCTPIELCDIGSKLWDARQEACKHLRHWYSASRKGHYCTDCNADVD